MKTYVIQFDLISIILYDMNHQHKCMNSFFYLQFFFLFTFMMGVCVEEILNCNWCTSAHSGALLKNLFDQRFKVRTLELSSPQATGLTINYTSNTGPRKCYNVLLINYQCNDHEKSRFLLDFIIILSIFARFWCINSANQTLRCSNGKYPTIR